MHDVLTAGMIRQIPSGFALLIRGGHAPVIARLARGWEHRSYKRLNRKGLAGAAVIAAPAPAPSPPGIPGPANAEPQPELAPQAFLSGVIELADITQINEDGSGDGHGNGRGQYPWSAR